MKLERLTAAMLHRAESKGKAAGWYDLCRDGYLPAEIAVFADPVVFANDVVQAVRSWADRNDKPVVSCAPKRHRSYKAPPEDWRAAFRSSVMRTGMILSLSQPMLEYLCAVADNVVWDRQLQGGSTLAHPCNSIATAASLEKRGLIRRRPDYNVEDAAQHRESHCELTEAGRTVVELLKSVGVFIEADAAIERRLGKR